MQIQNRDVDRMKKNIIYCFLVQKIIELISLVEGGNIWCFWGGIFRGFLFISKNLFFIVF